jgi:hypothetical protein
MGSELDLYCEKPLHNRVSYGAAYWNAFRVFVYDDIFSFNLHHKHKPVADVSHSVPVTADFFWLFLFSS